MDSPEPPNDPVPRPSGSGVLPFSSPASEVATDRVGMLIFLASWTMMFGAFFYGYFLLRIQAPVWPPPGVPPLSTGFASLNTVVLLASSAALELARRKLVQGDGDAFRRFMMGTVVLGGLFLALQLRLWMDTWTAGLRMTEGFYGSLVFFLSGFHAAHVLCGMGLLAWARMPVDGDRGDLKARGRVGNVALFWHFVDGIWGVIYILVFLV